MGGFGSGASSGTDRLKPCHVTLSVPDVQSEQRLSGARLEGGTSPGPGSYVYPSSSYPRCRTRLTATTKPCRPVRMAVLRRRLRSPPPISTPQTQVPSGTDECIEILWPGSLGLSGEAMAGGRRVSLLHSPVLALRSSPDDRYSLGLNARETTALTPCRVDHCVW